MSYDRETLLAEVRQEMVWRSPADDRVYVGSGTAGKPAPDVTELADELEREGLIEKRLPTSAVYRIAKAAP